MLADSELFKRVQLYAEPRGLIVSEHKKLGYGSDGTVWESSNSGVKAVHRRRNYLVERDSYLRLAQADVNSIGGFAVPRIIDFDDALKIIEMEIVQAPYLIDFGKVHLDAPPSYWNDPQMRENIYEEWRERFDDHWEEVAGVIFMLQKYGIYYVDPRESNINTDGLG